MTYNDTISPSPTAPYAFSGAFIPRTRISTRRQFLQRQQHQMIINHRTQEGCNSGVIGGSESTRHQSRRGRGGYKYVPFRELLVGGPHSPQRLGEDSRRRLQTCVASKPSAQQHNWKHIVQSHRKLITATSTSTKVVIPSSNRGRNTPAVQQVVQEDTPFPQQLRMTSLRRRPRRRQRPASASVAGNQIHRPWSCSSSKGSEHHILTIRPHTAARLRAPRTGVPHAVRSGATQLTSHSGATQQASQMGSITPSAERLTALNASKKPVRQRTSPTAKFEEGDGHNDNGNQKDHVRGKSDREHLLPRHRVRASGTILSAFRELHWGKVANQRHVPYVALPVEVQENGDPDSARDAGRKIPFFASRFTMDRAILADWVK